MRTKDATRNRDVNGKDPGLTSREKTDFCDEEMICFNFIGQTRAALMKYVVVSNSNPAIGKPLGTIRQGCLFMQDTCKQQDPASPKTKGRNHRTWVSSSLRVLETDNPGSLRAEESGVSSPCPERDKAPHTSCT
jgi:hypothetical protein